MKVLAIAQNTFREAIRNKILYSVVLFAALLVGLSALLGAITIGDQIKVIKDFGLFSLSFFGAVLTIISGVSLLNKEVKYKTVYNILSKPVHRYQFILGKHIGLCLTVGLLVALMGVGLVVFVSVFEGRIDWLLFQGVFFTILEVIIISSVAMFFSSLVVTTTLSGIFTLAAYISGRSIDYLNYFLSEGEQSNTVLVYVIKGFDIILPNLSLLNMNDQIVYGNAASIPHCLTALVYCLAYSFVALGLASLIFEKRELT